MNVQLLHGDCLELMDNIQKGSVDMILADLPYGTTACKWDTVLDLQRLWLQYERVIKDNGAIVLTASQPFTTVIINSNIKLFRYEWIWEKSKASNFLQASYMPLKAHENVCVFYKSTPTYNPQKSEGKAYKTRKRHEKHGSNPDVYNAIPNYTGREPELKEGRLPRTVQYFATAHMEGKYHPTQKPVALMEYLIKTYTNEGETVLDNCMGSGTTGLACKNTGRLFIGIEKDEKYFDVAQKRLSQMAAIADKGSVGQNTNTLF